MDATGWDERYRSKELIWNAGPNQFLPGLVDGLAAGRALDVATGEGRNAVWLAQQGWEVTGVDFERGRRREGQSGRPTARGGGPVGRRRPHLVVSPTR